jgi:hypothetical protein
MLKSLEFLIVANDDESQFDFYVDDGAVYVASAKKSPRGWICTSLMLNMGVLVKSDNFNHARDYITQAYVMYSSSSVFGHGGCC